MDDFDNEALCRVVCEFYSEEKYIQYPTLDSPLLAVKGKGVFSRECTTWWDMLRMQMQIGQ